MINKLNSILITTVLLLSITVSVLHLNGKQLEVERNKYRHNTDALLSDLKQLRIDSTTTAVDIKTLRLTLDEYRQYRAEDAEKIRKLGVRLNDLQMAAKHSLEINVPVEVDLKDSLIVRDTVRVHVKTVEMNTPYLQLSGTIEDNRLSGEIHLPVTLQQAVWIEPKHRFLWWRWGTKAVHQTVSSDNPYVEIRYSEVIEIRK
jgi:cell division protein FtsL